MKCPFCGKETVVYGDLIDSYFGAASYSETYEMSCDECGKTWKREENYKLDSAKDITK